MTRDRLSKRRLKEIRSLSTKKYRDRLGQTIVEGVRGVEAALDAGARLTEILTTESALDASGAAVERSGAPCYVVSDREMDRISDVETSQGVLAVVAVERMKDDRLDGLARIIALDGLQDPGNAGALIRTAAWFGVDAVVTAAGTVDLYNPKVVRAAMGGLWDVGHAHVDDLATLLRRLRSAGFTAYGADLEGTAAGEWTPSEPSVLVFGSEAHGISGSVAALLDERIVIPGNARRRGVESLNVAVAGGIAVYEWTRRRTPPRGTLEKAAK